MEGQTGAEGDESRVSSFSAKAEGIWFGVMEKDTALELGSFCHVKQFKGEFVWALSSGVQSLMTGTIRLVWACNSCSHHPPIRKQKCQCSRHILHFLQSRIWARDWCQAQWQSLPILINLINTITHRQSQRLLSQTLKLTMTENLPGILSLKLTITETYEISICFSYWQVKQTQLWVPGHLEVERSWASLEIRNPNTSWGFPAWWEPHREQLQTTATSQ